jgi:hypothetical protein
MGLCFSAIGQVNERSGGVDNLQHRTALCCATNSPRAWRYQQVEVLQKKLLTEPVTMANPAPYLGAHRDNDDLADTGKAEG